jgi:hypothetical protein
MKIGDILAWLFVLAIAVGLFIVIPLIGWKMGDLDRNGVKALLTGIVIVAKLVHSLLSKTDSDVEDLGDGGVQTLFDDKSK